MPSITRLAGSRALAPWLFALAATLSLGLPAPVRAQVDGEPVAAPAAVAAPVASDYASRIAAQFDAYVDKVVEALRGASRVGPAGFDARAPQLLGPGGKLLPLVYTELQTDRLIGHPRNLEILDSDDVTAALRGQNVALRAAHLVVTVANPGGASAIGVAIPADDLAPRLPEAAAVGGVLLFAASGEPFAINGTLSGDQLEVFGRFLPQKPPSLVVTEAPFAVAQSARSGLLIVTRLAPSQAAPEPQLPATLFQDPSVKMAEPPAKPSPELMRRLAVGLPLGLGAAGLLLILLGRRRRRRDLAAASPQPDMQGMESLDYLDALAGEPRGPRGPLDLDPGEMDAVAELEDPVPFEEGVGEVRTLAKREEAKPENPKNGAAEPETAPAEIAAAEPRVLEPEVPEIAATERGAAEPEVPESAATEPAAEEPEVPETAVAEPEPVGLEPVAAEDPQHEAPARPEPAEPDEVDRVLADLMEATAAAERPAPAESAQMRDRASRLKERLSEAPALGKEKARPADNPPPASLPGKSREVIHIGRTGSEEGLDTLRRHKTVNPGDVLITKGEAQTLVEKENERVFGKMQALTREVEIRTAEALHVHRETFRELLEQFEALQANRDADLAAMHDLKNELANEVTTATLKLKQAEAKATEGMLRLREQMDNLTRKLEGWAADSRISEERLTGALETIREGWENQLEAHAELRKEVQRLTELHQDISRKQEANADREGAERRSAIDQLAFQIKTVQLATENDFSVMASRLDELKGAINTVSGRMDRTEGSQAQALDAVYRKIEAGEAVEALKSRVARDLEDLKARLDKDETSNAELRGMLDAMQSAMREEASRILSQVVHEVEKGIATSTQSSVAYQNQIDALKEENARLSARQHQIVQLMASLHTAIGKADARASEEVERLKAQNGELQQMMLSMMRSPRPQAASPSPGPSQMPPAQRRPAPASPDGRPAAPPAPVHASPPPRPHAPAPDPEIDEDDDSGEAKPIDLWSRLLGRGDENTSARKRRTK